MAQRFGEFSRKRKDAAALAAWCFFIFVLSSFPGTSYPSQPFQHFDKLMHIFLYVPVGLLAARFFNQGSSRPFPVKALAFAALFGLTDELHQAWVPLRSPAFSDWLADCCGGLLGALVLSAEARWGLAVTVNNLVEQKLSKLKE